MRSQIEVLTLGVRSTFCRNARAGRWQKPGPTVLLACGLTLAACSSHPSVTSTSKPSAPAVTRGSVGATPAAAAPSTTGGSGIAMCQASQLTISMGPTGAVAGMFGGDLLFTNHGSTACQLAGWPTVVGVTSGGQTTTATQVKITQFGPLSSDVQAVTLNPGASAGIAFAANANNCSQSYERLQVSPPGSTQYQEISAWLPYLKSYIPSCAPMTISPAAPKSALPNPAPQA